MPAQSTSSAFSRLLELANEPSSEKRRDLLRSVTDVFLSEPTRSDVECRLFDDVVAAVAKDMDVQVRAELSARIADSEAPVTLTAKRLAKDHIDVAKPVLERSAHLTSEDLVGIIENASQEHMLAVTRRNGLAEAVSSALVDHGNDGVVASLLKNETAEINRETFEKVAVRAEKSGMLQAPLIRNRNIPLDLLNDMCTRVRKELRAEVMQRLSSASSEDLEAALEASRRHMQEKFRKARSQGPSPEDDARLEAEALVSNLQRNNKLNANRLIRFLQGNDVPAFSAALAALTGVTYPVANGVYKRNDTDALAMLMKSVGADLSSFATVAAMMDGTANGLSQIEKFGAIYRDVPMEAAQRAVRFWKVRDAA